MKIRRVVLGLAFIGLATGLSRPAAAQQSDPPAMHHAAVVIDTGDGTVRKICLAFPEAEITGIEALQRVDTRPNRFEPYGSKGVGVCMLCGVGCSSGSCFCDPSKFWAYYRSGPGDTTYQFSRAGASSTTVRDGDVEAWKWGTGGAPAKTSVSEVCNVPEPPARTTATPTTSATTTSELGQSPTSSAPIPFSTAAPTSTPASGATNAPRPATPPAPSPATTPAAPGAADPPLAGKVPEEAAPSPEAQVKRSIGSERGRAADQKPKRRLLDAMTGAAFVALLGGLLVWRARLRRANVRRVRTVR